MKLRNTLYLILIATFFVAIFVVALSEKTPKVQALEFIVEEASHKEIMSEEVQNLRKSTDEVMYQTYEILKLVDGDHFVDSDKKTCTKKLNP